jgi:adenylate kinase family enzyme
MRRISVVGCSGSGKTTFARALAGALGVPHLELDSVFHQADWQPLPREEFRAIAGEFAACESWVVDGNYGSVRDLVWGRADTVIWLDPPRGRVMRQVVRRTLSRMARRTELWNGNREQWRNLLRADPELSIILWAWTRYGSYEERYGAAQHDPANAHLEFIRVRTRAESAELLDRARRPAGQRGSAAG